MFFPYKFLYFECYATNADVPQCLYFELGLPLFKRSSKNVFVHVGGLGWSALDSGWWRVARIFCPLLLALAWDQTPQLGEKAKNGVKIGKISAREASPAVAPGFAHQFFFAHADFFLLFPTIRSLGPVNYRDFRETGPWFQAMLAPSPLSERPEGSR